MRGLYLLLLPLLAAAADGDTYSGRHVADVIDDFRDAGYPFAYSTSLVTNDLLVGVEPDAATPLDIVRQILEPHGLTVRVDSGVYLVVRQRPAMPLSGEAKSGSPATWHAKAVEEIAVSASRYMIVKKAATSRYSMDRRTIQTAPDVGDDPIRIVQRLPGTAASGVSARPHFRGGAENEIGIMLNGQRLFDPFHVRDYQDIFSAIDSRAVKAVEIFTGGFPVRYGNQMSGMIIMESLEAPPETHNEVGVSFYNTSLLTTGQRDNKQWLLSARRGNLDLVLDPQYGSPSYSDVFGRFGVELSPAMSVTLNALYAHDNVEIVLESEPRDNQQVSSDTRNLQVWLELDNRWSEALTSRTVLSTVLFDNARVGSINDEANLIGSVHDARAVRQIGLRQDFLYAGSDTHALEWGFEVRHSDADYDYRNRARYFGLAAMYANRTGPLSTDIAVSPKGASYALYLADRWRFGDDTTLEWGLRWDDQVYTEGSADAQLSPRLSLLQQVGDATEIRLSWGRYYQVQDIHELQVEDGVAEFRPAQRADHLIAGMRHDFDDLHSLRIEAFHKNLDSVQSRFENLFYPLGVIPEIQPDRVQVVPEDAMSRGVEISFAREGASTDWWVSYTWSEAVDRVEGHDQPRSWNQRHALQLGMSWNNERWDFALAAGVHSGWPATELTLIENGFDSEGEPQYIAAPGPRNADRYPTYASLDTRVARTWKFPRSSLMAFVEVTNLTDRENVCCLDWRLQGGALERDVDYWMPLLPAIGVRWEF